MSVSGWIGVDLDGTLAEYHGWNGGAIGEPVPAMLARVKEWLAKEQAVKIFTARACTGDAEQIALIKAWCVQHVGQELEVTAIKDFAMIELWDDRCVQVIPNTGIPIKERAQQSVQPTVLTHCPNDGRLLLMGFCDQCKSQYPHAGNA